MGMYNDYVHQGKSLAEWQKVFKNEYSLGELYRMAKDGTDLQKLVLENNNILTT